MSEKQIEFLPTYRDLMFKNLFGTSKNIEFTISLISSIYGIDPEELKDTIITNSVTLDRETVVNRKFEFNVSIELPNSDLINLEMQVTYDKNAEIKNFMYVTGMFYSQLKKGEDFESTKKVTGINFVKDLNLHSKNKAVQKYVMTNEEDANDKILPELFNVIVINVDHNCELFYNDDISLFEGWRRFIGADTLEELEKVSKSHPILEKALKECRRFMGIDYVQDYSVQEKLIRSQMKSMKEDGFAEGELKGRLETAKKLISKGSMSLEEIFEITELPLEKLKNIKNSITKEN